MRVKPMTAWRAVLSNTIFLAICLLLVPSVSLAKAIESNGFEKKDLVTTSDFIEYAKSTEL